MADYIYQRGSAPLLQWRDGIPPRPIRAADNVALGDVTIIPGGPEPIEGLMDDIKANFSTFAIGVFVGIFGYHIWQGPRR
jgi:hypothetical protein